MNLEPLLNRKNSFYFFVILFFTFLVFAKSFGYSFFIFDDYEYIKENDKITHLTLDNFIWFWRNANTKTPFFFNFIQLVSTIWSNQGASVMRLINVVAHGLNGFLVFKIISNLLSKIYVEQNKDSGLENVTIVSLFVSLFFIFHPVQVESIVWVYSMRGVLSSTFALISINSYLHFLDSHKNKYLYVTIATYTCGMLFKFNVATIPLVYVLFDYFLDKDQTLAKSFSKHWLLLSFGACFFFVFTYEYSSTYVSSIKVSTVDSIFILFRTTMHYLTRIIFPFNYRFDYGLNYSTYKSFLPNAWLNRFSLLSVILLTVYSIRQLIVNERNKYVFCYLLFIVMMFPGLGVIAHDFQYASFVADRYSYLGVVPFCLFLAVIMFQLFKSAPKIIPIFVIVLVSSFIISSSRLINLWEDPGQLLYKDYSSNLNSNIAFEGVINYYDQKNELKKIAQFIWNDTKKGVKHRQSYFKFVKYLSQSKNIHDGEIVIDAWKRSGVNFTDVLLFNLYIEAKLPTYAEEQYKKVVKLAPDILKENEINLTQLKKDLDNLKNDSQSIFYPWEQMTSRKYRPLSERLKLERLQRVPIAN